MLSGPAAALYPLERVAAGDRFADYCLWDYEPPTPPLGKLRSASLLWQSLAAIGASARLFEVCDLLRRELGPFRTVWGLKKFADRYALEFYFYDYARLDRAMSLEKVLRALSPMVECELQYPGARPYFMFSLDLDDFIVNEQKRLNEVSIYVGNPGSTVSSGICYNLSAAGLRLDNFYFFFDAKREMAQICDKIACSAHHDLPDLPIDDILWPQLRECGVVVVANKKHHDGIYFSRIDVDQLIHFLGRTSFPAPLLAFVRNNRNDLDHMLYDVGIDYVRDGASVKIVKSAFYGLL